MNVIQITIEEEKKRIKLMEERLRMEKLGYAPKTKRDASGDLNHHDLEHLKRGTYERDEKDKASQS